MIYTFLYIFSLISGLVTSFNSIPLSKNTKRKLYLILTFGMIFLMAGLRKFTVGSDTNNYIRFFSEVSNTPINNLNTQHLEIGFVLFVKTITLFTNNAQIFLLISSLIINLGFAKFIYQNSENHVLSTLVFIALFFTSTLNLTRQYMAVIAGCNSLIYIKKEDYKRATLLIVLSVMVHLTGVLNIIIAILYLLRKNKYFIIYIFMISTIILLSINGDIFNLIVSFFGYESYLTSVHMTESTTGDLMGKIYLILIAIGFLLLYLSRNMKQDFSYTEWRFDFKFYLGILIIGTIFTLLSAQYRLFSRIGIYFTIYLVLFIPSAFRFFRRKKYQSLYAFGIILFCFLMFIALQRTTFSYNYEFFFH